MFKESFSSKQNPFKGNQAWEVNVVSEINENMGEYYSDDPIPSDPDSSEADDNDGFKPLSMEQRRREQ